MTDRRIFGQPGHCYSIDGDWWHEPGTCQWCKKNPCCGVTEQVPCETHTYGSPSDPTDVCTRCGQRKPWELVIRCPAHGEPEPCLTCRGYIAAGL